MTPKTGADGTLCPEQPPWCFLASSQPSFVRYFGCSPPSLCKLRLTELNLSARSDPSSASSFTDSGAMQLRGLPSGFTQLTRLKRSQPTSRLFMRSIWARKQSKLNAKSQPMEVECQNEELDALQQSYVIIWGGGKFSAWWFPQNFQALWLESQLRGSQWWTTSPKVSNLSTLSPVRHKRNAIEFWR